MSLNNAILHLLFTCFFGLAGLLAKSQDNTGHIQLIQDSRIDTLVQKHIQFNQLQPTIDGYRIQIYFESGNNARTMANRVRDRFLELFPYTGAYLTFNEPYYRVRVGDYRTKMAAESFLSTLSLEFPNAFIVAEQVYFEKLEAP